jgi:hypothetical protein
MLIFLLIYKYSLIKFRNIKQLNLYLLIFNRLIQNIQIKIIFYYIIKRYNIA